MEEALHTEGDEALEDVAQSCVGSVCGHAGWGLGQPVLAGVSAHGRVTSTP